MWYKKYYSSLCSGTFFFFACAVSKLPGGFNQSKRSGGVQTGQKQWKGMNELLEGVVDDFVNITGGS